MAGVGKGCATSRSMQHMQLFKVVTDPMLYSCAQCRCADSSKPAFIQGNREGVY